MALSFVIRFKLLVHYVNKSSNILATFHHHRFPPYKACHNRREPEIDGELIAQLERLSLVNFNNAEGVERLKKHIESANQLSEIDVTGVEPLITVLEDRNLYLNKDEVHMDTTREDILKNAAWTEEEYFIAPPGNIPLKQDKTKYDPPTRKGTHVSRMKCGRT